MFDPELFHAATVLLDRLRAHNQRVVTAESCTGGLIAACLTAVPGSSDGVDRGYVTYSNAAKTEMLGVPAADIAAFGAVSQVVAGHMAAGALARSGADLAVAVTGIAGPGGGSAEKPVGLVWFGLATHAGVRTDSRIFPGDRDAVRRATVLHALTLLGQGSTETAVRDTSDTISRPDRNNDDTSPP